MVMVLSGLNIKESVMLHLADLIRTKLNTFYNQKKQYHEYIKFSSG